MELHEMIDHRRSVRSYTGTPVDAATLRKIEALMPTRPSASPLPGKTYFLETIPLLTFGYFSLKASSP